MFWFMWKRLAGSCFVFIAASRASFAVPYAAFSPPGPSSATLPETCMASKNSRVQRMLRAVPPHSTTRMSQELVRSAAIAERGRRLQHAVHGAAAVVLDDHDRSLGGHVREEISDPVDCRSLAQGPCASL
jgi:hypothetical protein